MQGRDHNSKWSFVRNKSVKNQQLPEKKKKGLYQFNFYLLTLKIVYFPMEIRTFKGYSGTSRGV